MKARINYTLSKEQLIIAEEIKKKIMDDQQKEQNRAIQRTVKMACYALASEYGFGLKRLEKFLEHMHELSDEVFSTPEQWYYIDEYLTKKGLAFEPENIDERVQHTQICCEEQHKKFRKWG